MSTLAEHAAAHLRAEMARRRITAVQLGKRLGVSSMWVSRRMRGRVPMTMEDVERLAAELGLEAASFLTPQRVP